MRWLLRSPKQSTALVEASDDIGLTQSAQVDTGSVQDSTDPQQGDDQSIPVEIEGEVPLNFGALRSPQEHAAKLVERMRAQGSVVYGRSFHQGELEDFHWRICKELRWLWRKWPSVGRELKKLPGVRKGKVWFDGQRLTVYEIGPAPAEAIVDLAEEKLRKRA